MADGIRPDTTASQWAGLREVAAGPNAKAATGFLESEAADMGRSQASTFGDNALAAVQAQHPEVDASHSAAHHASEARQRAHNATLDPVGAPAFSPAGTSPSVPKTRAAVPKTKGAVLPTSGPATSGGR